jgi:glycosyltransferase involved in cell wall biosynthesis
MSSSQRTHGQPPLRIAFVTPEPIPGGGVPGAAVLIARGLAELGHEVDCWSSLEYRIDTSWADVPGLTLHFVDSPFRWDRWYTNARARPLITNLVLLGSKAWATPTLVRRLLARHREQPYDVVYRFSTLELLGFGRKLRHLPPVVVHPEVHAAGELRWLRNEQHLARRCQGTVQRNLVRAVLALRTRRQRRDVHRVAGVIAPSRRFAELLAQDYGLDPAVISVVPNPIDVDRFHPVPRQEGRRRVKITYVGRAAVRKGIDALIALSHRLDDRADEVEIEVIATASLWSDYRPLLADLNPRVAVVSLPRYNHHVADVLAQSDLLLQPSRYEPFALTVAEALASGTPVVATDEVGASEGVDRRCLDAPPAGDLDALEHAVRTRVDAVLAGRDAEAREVARSEAERLFAPSQVCAALADRLAAAAGRPASERASS